MSTLLILDNFTAADSTNLDGWTPSPTNTPGNNWVVSAGTWEINSNKARRTADDGTIGAAVAVLNARQSDFTVSAVLSASLCGIVGRCVSTPSTSPKWELYHDGTNLQIYEDDTTLRATVADTFVAGDVYSLSFSGNTITASHGATSVIYTSSAGATNTYAGLMSYGSSAKTFDDFTVTVSQITDNLTLYLKLDEASGNAADALGSFDLTQNGTAGTTTGKIGNARTLSSGAYFSHAHNAAFDPGTGPWSVSFWAKANSTVSSPYFISHEKTTANYNGYGVYLEDVIGPNANKIVAESFDGSSTTQVASISTAVSDGSWHHIVVTRSGSTITIYIDGVLDNSGSNGMSGSISQSATLAIGAFADGSQSLNGTLDEFGLWIGKALNLGEVLTLNNANDGLAYPLTDISVDATSNSGYQSATSSLSWSHTWQGSSRMLVVDVHMLSVTNTVTAMTYGGANCTFIGATNVAGGTGRVESWRILQNDSGAPTSGSNTISVTISGSLACSGTAVSYTNVHQTSPTEAFLGTSGINVGAADATVTITPTMASTRIHGAVSTSDTSITANQKNRNNVTGATGSGANEDTAVVVSPTGTAISYTGVGALASWVIQGFAIRPAGASSLSNVFFFAMAGF